MHSYIFLVFFTCVTVMITITSNDYRFQAGDIGLRVAVEEVLDKLAKKSRRLGLRL